MPFLTYTAAWDYRNQCTDSMTPSLTKRAADTLDRRQDNPTDRKHSQVKFFTQILELEVDFNNIFCCLGHSSPGGDLSDEELCLGIANLGGTITPLGSGCAGGPSNECESLCFPSGSAVMDFTPTQQHSASNTPTAARPRSGSCTSKRSQFR